jgi:hypothetical protein
MYGCHRVDLFSAVFLALECIFVGLKLGTRIFFFFYCKAEVSIHCSHCSSGPEISG